MDALRYLGDDPLSFLLFPVDQPERFDAVLTDDLGRVQEIRVKDADPRSSWIWGALKLDITDRLSGLEAYVDVGTLHGYREAIRVLSARPIEGAEALT